ncbi:hypothetical protein GJU42_04180 [Flavobacterium resistens]|uniref:Uncharacterized protein n=1 Tax=Flavobacterium resistens TaxID=443612 RepID=A0ABW9Q2Z2_9FLAO|nr:hypothetical protein [Flavobacterium resistens]MRX67154.1 hypothetical protein [Flavobacterium resistens]
MSSSTKIGEFLDGVTYEDFSFVEMTNFGELESKTEFFNKYLTGFGNLLGYENIIIQKRLFTPNALAPIVVEILLCLVSLTRHKRLKRIAGLAPKKSTNK